MGHGSKFGAGNWFLWGVGLTVFFALLGIGALVIWWIFVILMMITSEKKYHNTNCYVGNKVKEGSYTGEKNGVMVTAKDFGFDELGLSPEKEQKEVIKEIAIRNQIAKLPPNKRTDISLMAILHQVDFYGEQGVDEEGRYRKIVVKEKGKNGILRVVKEKKIYYKL